MKKMFSLLVVICMMLVLAPISVDAKAHLGDNNCETTVDPSDSTRKVTICEVIMYDVEPGELDGQTQTFKVAYFKPHDKSDFIMGETISGIEGEITKTNEGGTFDFTFNNGLSGDVVLFKMSFYSDKTLSGKDCGGYLSFTKPDGTVSSSTTSSNTESNNGDTGVSAPVIIVGVGLLACLAVYATTSKKTKMHRI